MPITANQQAQLAVRLDTLVAEARDYLADSAEASQTVELDQTKQGRLSRMDAIQAQSMSAAARRRAEALLQRIAHTRKRLDNPGFGECIDCELPIACARLHHDSTTLRCRDCTASRE